MKKLTISLFTSSLVVGLLINTNTSSYATDFVGQEEKYIDLCRSSNLSTSNQDTCRDFNEYLKTKNEDLDKQISDTKENMQNSKNSLDEITHELTILQQEIATKESEITYLQTTITNLEASIEEKELEIRDRMYAMQSHINSSLFIEFIFSASSFTDLLSRLDSVNEITSNDRELIMSLHVDKEDLETQQATMNTAKANLDAKHQNQLVLQNNYLALYQEQNSDLISQERQSLENTSTSEEIDDNLAALAAATRESEVQGITQATPPANPTPPATDNNPNTDSGNNGGGSTQPRPPVGGTGNYQLGIQIANHALTRQGSPYVWGAAGPNAFDCSGLVHWAHQQAGVHFGRVNSVTLAGMGTPVAFNQLQAGDVLTFRTNGHSVSHVGIYIGNGQMVHASVPGTPVNVVSIHTAYWQSVYHNARRLY